MHTRGSISEPSTHVLVRVLVAAFAIAALQFAAPIHSAPVNLKMALANLGRSSPPARSIRASQNCGVGAATAVASIGAEQPDEIFANGFDNSGSQCIMISDCPDTGSECVLRVCTDGVCSQQFAQQGTACATGVCDDSGTCTPAACIVNGDCPDTGSACVLKVCMNGFCSQAAAPGGTPCPGGACDGSGSCSTTACNLDDDCPETGSECMLKKCSSGFCTQTAAPGGTPCTGGVCDGSGTCLAPVITKYGWPDPFGGTKSTVTGTVLAYRITIPNPTTLDKFGIVTASSSGDWKLALYTDSSNQPGSLVAQMDTSASITSNGDQNADIVDVALAAGDYWIAYRSSPSLLMGYSGANPTARLCSRNLSIPSLDTAWPSTFGAASCLTTGILNLYVVTYD